MVKSRRARSSSSDTPNSTTACLPSDRTSRLNVVTSWSTLSSSRTPIVPCSMPTGTVRRKSLSTTSGAAAVARSTSCWTFPSNSSRTAPPTHHVSWPASSSRRRIARTGAGTGMSPPVCSTAAINGPVRSPLADPDIAERQRTVVVALDADVPSARPAIIRPGGELAQLDLRLPIRTAQLVFEQLRPVEPVLDVGSSHDDPRRVPFVRGLDGSRRGRIQAVCRASSRQANLAVGCRSVIEQLVLRSAPVDVLVLLGGAIEDPRIAGRAELPVQREFKVPELLPSDEIAGTSRLRQHAAHDPPSRRHRVGLVAAPAIGRTAVEQEMPARLPLRGGQRVGRALRNGAGRAGGEQYRDDHRMRCNSM